MAATSLRQKILNYLAIDPDMATDVVVSKIRREHGLDVNKQYIHTERSAYKKMLSNARPTTVSNLPTVVANGTRTVPFTNGHGTKGRHTSPLSVSEQNPATTGDVLAVMASLKHAVSVLGADNVRRAVDLFA